LLDRQVLGLCDLQELSGINAGETVGIGVIAAVADQAAGIRECR
jgi:hypothetical protein